MDPRQRSLDCVVGYHLNPHTCGIAKFNLVLARQLQVPIHGLADPAVRDHPRILLSIKTEEFSEAALHLLTRFLDELKPQQELQLFLHAYADTPLERRFLERAERVYCGNSELAGRLRPHHRQVVEAWCPGSFLETQRFEPSELTVLTFGMAHKVRASHFEKLQTLLEATGKSYSLFVSTALHEGTTFEGSFAKAFAQIQEIFRGQAYFLGYLSDAGVYNYLLDTTYFAAFFEKGVRENNTSVNSAMECGAVVITNLDDLSPATYRGGRNLIDIATCEQLPTKTEELQEISAGARQSADEFGWKRLVDRLAGPMY